MADLMSLTAETIVSEGSEGLNQEDRKRGWGQEVRVRDSSTGTASCTRFTQEMVSFDSHDFKTAKLCTVGS